MLRRRRSGGMTLFFVQDKHYNLILSQKQEREGRNFSRVRQEHNFFGIQLGQ
jgi:hypothetical protein